MSFNSAAVAYMVRLEAPLTVIVSVFTNSLAPRFRPVVPFTLIVREVVPPSVLNVGLVAAVVPVLPAKFKVGVLSTTEAVARYSLPRPKVLLLAVVIVPVEPVPLMLKVVEPTAMAVASKPLSVTA